MTALAALHAPAPFLLWRAALTQTPPDAAIAQLAPAERERAARFRFERDRRRYLAAHCALRTVLSDYTGLPPHLLAYQEGPYGKPEVANRPRACVFNLSHSEDTAVIALAPAGQIGVDVEMLRAMPDAADLAARNFTPAEQLALAEALPSQRDLAFLRGWTRKEACLKAIGSGLSIGAECVDTGLHPDERIVQVDAISGRARLRVWSLHLDGTTVCALAQVIDSTIALHAERY